VSRYMPGLNIYINKLPITVDPMITPIETARCQKTSLLGLLFLIFAIL